MDLMLLTWNGLDSVTGRTNEALMDAREVMVIAGECSAYANHGGLEHNIKMALYRDEDAIKNIT